MHVHCDEAVARRGLPLRRERFAGLLPSGVRWVNAAGIVAVEAEPVCQQTGFDDDEQCTLT